MGEAACCLMGCPGSRFSAPKVGTLALEATSFLFAGQTVCGFCGLCGSEEGIACSLTGAGEPCVVRPAPEPRGRSGLWCEVAFRDAVHMCALANGGLCRISEEGCCCQGKGVDVLLGGRQRSRSSGSGPGSNMRLVLFSSVRIT